ncbi:hydroxyacylglutathione hydrolase [Variibacter gotjawalensis]|uniref:Hydroxyacylglutathione hydrolase n=1 Tax=Variibacter gotjawalensis TaxID=1333996 RepID=A0A0S3Q081_9BRAD|nr:MBL fold metallo-hydrolase [Variibacter gotjawalensis]NIK47395.1 glyoxylase-like metal-dependent hydrolase (beta-lactamase superfamily II) [Variibacter gotjawalensis]RZS49291.1 glyoxylase-like metal-dependent hydrolase (beta-lactamase superfamily II) [Variibacter gotjawalensis]BAT61555.1 hydroxyacylglutathione hydrolase [Variibacter gotjawalensis]
MSDDIPFQKKFNLAPGVVDEVLPGIRRIVAPNPGPFTFTGTVTYILGHGNVAIIDPGPDSPEHVAKVLQAIEGETLTHVFITHTHRDHSPGLRHVKAKFDVPAYGEGPHRASRPLHEFETTIDVGGDQDFKPDVVIRDGDVIKGDGWALEAVATPGHTANHMAFALQGTDILFSGDHVMGWSTSIVAPPDGSMQDYMASLAKLRERNEDLYLPGHGGEVRDARRYVKHFVAHRKARETSILKNLSETPTDIPSLVQKIYVGLDQRLRGAAALSVLAHLEDLVARGAVMTDGEPSIKGLYRALV